MKRIGFVGLGTMGTPMVRNLIKADYELVVYDRVAERIKLLVESGAKVAASPAEVARQSEVVITMLPADQAVKEVVLGASGIAEGASAGLIVIDSSTVLPATSKLLAAELAKMNVDMLDAPVTGSEPQAVEGKLTFIVGGKQEIYNQCVPIFKTMGKTTFHMGPNGAGSYTKLANNTISAITLVAFSEGVVLATKAGIDPKRFVEVISIGGARSGQIDNKAPKILSRDFHPNFATALMFKDLGLAGEVARELNVPTPAMAIAREMLNIAIAKGYGLEDVCSVVKCYEEWAHTEVHK
jgi:3-hydroxyisobutyrate dehydrogenase